MIWIRGRWLEVAGGPAFAALETLDMLDNDDIRCVKLNFALSLFATDSARISTGSLPSFLLHFVHCHHDRAMGSTRLAFSPLTYKQRIRERATKHV